MKRNLKSIIKFGFNRGNKGQVFIDKEMVLSKINNKEIYRNITETKKLFTENYFKERGDDLNIKNSLLDPFDNQLLVTASDEKTVFISNIEINGPVIVNSSQVNFLF